MLALLSRLVAIDSVNPALVPGAAGEREIAAFVAGWAREAGLEVETLEGTPGRPSVVVRARGRGGGRTLLLCGHLDTVTVAGMDDPHTPRVDGDRLYGRGAYDMKCGLAAALVACRDAAELGLAGDVVVAAVADEEHASLGVQEVLEHVRADAAIVTEPTELELIVAHKGFVWAQIEVTGRAAHGSRPQLGVDAIVKSGPVLTALGELDAALAGREHPRLGRGSVHASLIQGGEELSSIPGRCVLQLERRTLPGETAADVRGRARRAARDVPRGRPGARRAGAHAARARAVRDRRRRRARHGGRRCGAGGRRRGAADRRRELLGGRRVHRRRRDPDRHVRTGGRRRARDRGVGQPELDRHGGAHARRRRRQDLRVSCFVNPAADATAVPPASGDAAAFHLGLPGYRPTPVRELPSVAAQLGVEAVGVKDESDRLGLPAFKVLGASWAVERTLRADPGVHTLVTASAGNHGRAVAHVAAMRGLRCRVFLPQRAVAARREAIAGEGAEVVIVDGTYEEAVAASAAAAAAGPGVAELADVGTSGPARWVVDGYATLFREVAEQFSHDLLVVPVGVGSLAAAAARHAAAAGAFVVGAEPVTAACLTASLQAGEPTVIATPGTTMAGLDCAEVSPVAWPTLQAGIHGTVTVSDDEVADAVRELAAAGLLIGESGAAPLAALRQLAGCRELRAAARLAPDSRVLLVATEGPTDPVSHGEALRARPAAADPRPPASR